MSARLNGQQVRWRALADADAIAHEIALRIAAAAERAIAARGSFHIVLAGGESPRAPYRLLRDAHCDWQRWHVYFGDERCAPREDELRNSRMAALAWLDLVAIPATQIHVIPGELGADAGARAYVEVMRGVGEFDLVLLGFGPDGHTASLFPRHAWGTDEHAADVLAVYDAPFPTAERISLSAARLSRAREVLFMVNGLAKRQALTDWRAGTDLPVRAITPAAGVDVLCESALLV